MREEKGLLLRLLLFIILMPVYLLVNLILIIVTILNAVIGKIGGFVGFFLILVGFLGCIGILSTGSSGKTCEFVMMGLGVLCYLIPLIIDMIIEGLQSFSEWIMMTVIDT